MNKSLNLNCPVTLRERARMSVITTVHARVLTDERAQLARRSRRLTDGGGLTRSQGRKYLWKSGRNSVFFVCNER